jgi:4-amino-4-deoxychorismate lyase
MPKTPDLIGVPGVFETLAVVNGRPRFLARHLARLLDACRRLGIELPARSALAANICEQAAMTGAGVVKLVVTQGPNSVAEPSRPTIRAEPPRQRPLEWSRDGVCIRTCRTRLTIEPRFAGLKMLDRRAQVLARSEWTAPTIAEGLMLDEEGRLVCGTMTNVYAVIDGAVCTPAIVRCGVAGIMREALLEYWQEIGQSTIVGDLDPGELKEASEIFLSNALIGVWPVRALDEQTLAVGPVARAAASWVQRIVK